VIIQIVLAKIAIVVAIAHARIAGTNKLLHLTDKPLNRKSGLFFKQNLTIAAIPSYAYEMSL